MIHLATDSLQPMLGLTDVTIARQRHPSLVGRIDVLDHLGQWLLTPRQPGSGLLTGGVSFAATSPIAPEANPRRFP
jgi:hypothetical protein